MFSAKTNVPHEKTQLRNKIDSAAGQFERFVQFIGMYRILTIIKPEYNLKELASNHEHKGYRKIQLLNPAVVCAVIEKH
jgi:hypothetical protein